MKTLNNVASGLVITFEKMMLVLIKTLYSRKLDPDIKAFILFAAHKNGLVDERGETTPRYFAFLNDSLESVIVQLTGYRKKASGLCSCGCVRDPKGRGKYATAACRQKASRTLKRLKKETS